MPETISGTGDPSFVGFRQHNMKCTDTVALSFDAASEQEKAGLTIFQSEHNYYYLCKSVEKGKPVVELYQSTAGEEMKLLATQPLSGNNVVQLRITANGDSYSFAYAQKGKNWQALKENVDGKFLSTKVAGGFVGSVFGMYATSLGKATNNRACFDWFEYAGNDDVYKINQSAK